MLVKEEMAECCGCPASSCLGWIRFSACVQTAGGNESCRIVQLLGACQNPQRRCSVHGDRQEMWPRVRVPECIIAGPLSHRAAPAASADPRQAVANKQPNKQTRANPTTELDETRASNRTCVLSRYPKLSTDTSPPAPTLTHTLPLSLSVSVDIQ